MATNFLYRSIEAFLKYLLSDYKILAVVGPRQSGKTTLVKHVFPTYNYYNLEDLETQNIIQNDPKSIINADNLPMILDEAQKLPTVFSQLQVLADSIQKNGQIILSGSSHILMQKHISQSLAGRMAVTTLLPFTYSELKINSISIDNLDDFIFIGGYPGIVTKSITSKKAEGKNSLSKMPSQAGGNKILSIKDYKKVSLFYKNYINTYLYKDILDLLRIRDTVSFINLLKHVAFRTGQLVNLQSLAVAVGKSHTTIKEWLDTLSATFIIFYLRPFYQNFGKRLIKAPKIFFYDTGVLSYLAGINDTKNLRFNVLYGQIFENFVIADYIKTAYNVGVEPNAYFWRSASGIEIDLIIEHRANIFALEIKSAMTFKTDFLKNLEHIKKLNNNIRTFVVYRGDRTFNIKGHKVYSIKDIDKLWKLILKGV